MITKGTVVELRGARNYARFIDILLSPGGTVDEIVEYTGFSESTVLRYIKALRELPVIKTQRKKCRIIGWAPDARGYHTRAIYALQPGRDVPRPRMTGAEKSRRYRQRKKPCEGHASVFTLGQSMSM